MAVYAAGEGDYATAAQHSDHANRLSPSETDGDNVIRKLALACLSDTPVQKAQLEQVGSINDFGRPVIHTVLGAFPQWIKDEVCIEFPFVRFADTLATAVTRPEVSNEMVPETYLRLAALESAIGRADRAYRYSLEATKRAVNDPQVLLMQFFYALESGHTSAAASAIHTLVKLEQAGKLSVMERRTLALYMERQR
jgi:hypothetical protein